MLDNLKKYNIVLASKSPRRQELLKGIGVDFTILTKEVDESYPSRLPSIDVAPFLSLKKAKAFEDTELPENYMVITADTVVIIENEILGKPKDREDAIRMIKQLSGKVHKVVTGVTVHFANGEYDQGPIIAQRAVVVREDDTVDTLEERIHEVEHEIYPEVLGWIADGRVSIDPADAGLIEFGSPDACSIEDHKSGRKGC